MSSHFVWIWTLTGICYSTDSEHSFCCFTDYTKLYVCAHRVLLLHDLRQDLLWYCPEFPGDGLTPALDWPAESAGWTGVAGKSRWHGLHSSPEPWYWESICSLKCVFIWSLQYRTQGWEEGNVCSASNSAAEWLYYLRLPQLPHVQELESTAYL